MKLKNPNQYDEMQLHGIQESLVIPKVGKQYKYMLSDEPGMIVKVNNIANGKVYCSVVKSGGSGKKSVGDEIVFKIGSFSGALKQYKQRG